MEAQFQKGRCPGCKATGTLLVESDHSIGCDSCEGLWEIEDLLRIIHASQSLITTYKHVAESLGKIEPVWNVVASDLAKWSRRQVRQARSKVA